MANVIEYIDVDGYWFSVDAAKARGSVNVPQILPVFGYVDLIPRVPEGFTVLVKDWDHENNPAGTGLVADTAMAIPVQVGRIWNGRLSTVNTVDTPCVKVVANTVALGLTPEVLPETEGKLIYDVRFREITYNQLPHHISPFAFEAKPGVITPILLSDKELERLPYEGPGTGWNFLGNTAYLPEAAPTHGQGRAHVPLTLLKGTG
jgi:hypothetical protein